MTRGVATDIFGRNVRKSRRGKRSGASAESPGGPGALRGEPERSCGRGAREKAREKRKERGRVRGVGRGNIRRAGDGQTRQTVTAGEKSRFSGGRRSEMCFGVRQRALRFASVNRVCERAVGGGSAAFLGVSRPWSRSPGALRVGNILSGVPRLGREHHSGCRVPACCRACLARGPFPGTGVGTDEKNAPCVRIRRIFSPCADAAADCRPDAACGNTVRVPPRRRWRRILSAAR